MKKVIFKNVLVAWVFTMGFLFFGTVDSNAQVTQTNVTVNPLFLVPTGSFVGTDEAKDILLAEMMSIKAQLAGLTGQPAAVLTTRLNYFMGIYTVLESGKNVPEAIVDGLGYIRQTPTTGPSEATMTSLKQQAINLLS